MSFACTIGADIDRTLPTWQPRSVRKPPETEPEPAPEPTQCQGPGARKAGESQRRQDRPDPLAALAKEICGK
eukprot:COSAG02_NODE_13311_length_1411_cov_1.799543_2_plen_72_part_00